KRALGVVGHLVERQARRRSTDQNEKLKVRERVPVKERWPSSGELVQRRRLVLVEFDTAPGGLCEHECLDGGLRDSLLHDAPHAEPDEGSQGTVAPRRAIGVPRPM